MLTVKREKESLSRITAFCSHRRYLSVQNCRGLQRKPPCSLRRKNCCGCLKLARTSLSPRKIRLLNTLKQLDRLSISTRRKLIGGCCGRYARSYASMTHNSPTAQQRIGISTSMPRRKNIRCDILLNWIGSLGRLWTITRSERFTSQRITRCCQRPARLIRGVG